MSVDTWPTVCGVATEMLIECQLSVNQDIKCQLSVDQQSTMINNDHDQQSTADPFLTWKKFVFKEKLL